MTELRRILLAPGLLLLTGATPAGGSFASVRPDAALIDKGDLGIATYAMLFVIVALLIDRWLERKSGAARDGMIRGGIDKLAEAIDRNTQASTDRSTVELVHNARVESIMSRVDARLERMERSDAR